MPSPEQDYVDSEENPKPICPRHFIVLDGNGECWDCAT